MNENKNEITEFKNENEELNVLEGEIIDDDIVVKLDNDCSDSKQNLLGLFNVFKLGIDTKKLIQPDHEYLVKFPPALLKKMKEHDLEFLKDSLTGELLPILYDRTEKNIGGQIRLELRNNVTAEQWGNLGNSISQSINQARFDNFTDQIEQLTKNVQRIQQGQDSDRFAEIQAGIGLLDDAKNSNSKINRILSAHSAKEKLKTGANKVKNALISELESLPDISDSPLSRIWFTLQDPENRPNLLTSYNQIQIYFENYYKALIPLAEAYTLIGEPERIEALIESTSVILNHKDLEKLKRAEKLLPVGYDYSINWYNKPQKIQQKIRDSYSLEEVSESEFVKLSGKEILTLQEGNYHD